MTMTFFGKLLVLGLVVVTTGFAPNPQETDGSRSPAASRTPVLISVCLITNNVDQVVDFYEKILGVKARERSERYAEISSGVGVIAIFSAAAQEKYIPGSTEPARNKSVILEFRVDDVDREYTRLQNVVKTWVKPPTTQPWGTRSFYFRDPDGNLIDFYAPIKAH